MREHHLHTDFWLPRPIEEVFAFFSDAHNLDAITPPWLKFRILTPRSAALHAGALLDYRLRWRGLPLRWQTEISHWEPPHRFVDQQCRGPYRQWIHEHTFEPADGGTRLRDHVRYAVPGGPLEPLLHRLLVGPDVRRIFAFRQDRMQELFGRLAGTGPSC
jgi:ligand-binding SRPBCC domain-containing protein